MGRENQMLYYGVDIAGLIVYDFDIVNESIL